MEVLGWLLLSLLTVQAVTSQDLHRHHRDFRDARGIQESELEDWIDLPRTLARGEYSPIQHILTYLFP